MYRLAAKDITVAILIGRELDKVQRPLMMKELPVVAKLSGITLRPVISKLIHARVLNRDGVRSGIEKGEKWEKYFSSWMDQYGT